MTKQIASSPEMKSLLTDTEYNLDRPSSNASKPILVGLAVVAVIFWVWVVGLVSPRWQRQCLHLQSGCTGRTKKYSI